MEVRVKREHIDAGERYESGVCPVALAIKEATGRKLVNVGYGAFEIGSGRYTRSVDLPEHVRTWTKAFDSGEPVFAFEFELPDDYAVIREGNRQ